MSTVPRPRGWGARPVRPAVPFLAVLGLVLLVAACGGAPPTGADPGGERSVSPAPPAQPPATVPSEVVPSPEPAVVDPVPGRHERQVTWRLVGTAPGPAVVVEVQAGGAPCDAVTGVDVTESASTVRLTVWAGRTPGADCHGIPATLGTLRLRVPLKEPLGTRTLEQP